MLLVLFLVAFFGLLAAGMPIFLVLGVSAAGLVRGDRDSRWSRSRRRSSTS